jgi:hypothetical protein
MVAAEEITERKRAEVQASERHFWGATLTLASNAKPPAYRFNVASVVCFLNVPDCLITRTGPVSAFAKARKVQRV